VTDDPDTVMGACENPMATETELRLHSSLDLAEIARLVLSAAVPDFAGVATVFILEHPLRVGEPGRSGGGAEIAARRLGTRQADVGQQVTRSIPGRGSNRS
jgi:hypothetical protein